MKFWKELVYIRDRAWYSNENISPRPYLRPLQLNGDDPTGERSSKLENIRSDDHRRNDDPTDTQHVDLGNFTSLVVEGSRIGKVHRLLSDSEARDHLENLSPSEREVPQLVLEKASRLAEVIFKLEIDTLYESRESRRKRLMSPLIPLSGHRTEVRRAVVALPARACEGDLMVRISSSGLFVIREWSQVPQHGQESSTGHVQQVSRVVEAQQKSLSSLRLPISGQRANSPSNLAKSRVMSRSPALLGLSGLKMVKCWWLTV